jgi:hypothetical protein
LFFVLRSALGTGEGQSIMSARDSYRRNAEACLEAAETMRDLNQRIAMLRLAQLYLALDDRIRPGEAPATGKQPATSHGNARAETAPASGRANTAQTRLRA